MLKGISPSISPDLLKILAEMGHGDELVIGDCNFPAASMGKRCVRADGVSGPEILDAVLSLFPLDIYVDTPVTLMKAALAEGESAPAIWDEYKAIIERHQPGTKIEWIDRFDFYDRTRNAYAAVATSERALYACIILKKGVL